MTFADFIAAKTGVNTGAVQLYGRRRAVLLRCASSMIWRRQ
jgi:hypothetical protein